MENTPCEPVACLLDTREQHHVHMMLSCYVHLLLAYRKDQSGFMYIAVAWRLQYCCNRTPDTASRGGVPLLGPRPVPPPFAQ